MPIRDRRTSSEATPEFRSARAVWTSTAHWTASTAKGNSAGTAVACGVGHPATMLPYEAVHYLPVSREGTQRSHLIPAHEARITRNVSGEDRRQAPLNPP